jgi:hypothetical protein
MKHTFNQKAGSYRLAILLLASIFTFSSVARTGFHSNGYPLNSKMIELVVSKLIQEDKLLESDMKTKYTRTDQSDSAEYKVVFEALDPNMDIPFYAIIISQRMAFGDLNGDGTEECIVEARSIYSSNPLVTYYFIFSGGKDNPKINIVFQASLGESKIGEFNVGFESSFKTFSITNARIITELMAYGPQDDYGSPTIKLNVVYKYVQNKVSIESVKQIEEPKPVEEEKKE